MVACIAFTLLTTLYPVARAFFRGEVDYNEGWNVYNTQLLVHHLPLYPVAYGWQTVNYPMLSFALLAFLHRFTHEYLFTARMVSLLALIACCALVGTVVRQLGASLRAGVLAGFFTLALFCTNANAYVGMDDPQMLAQVFFLLGFALYLANRTRLPVVALSAVVFVFAGSIKHNPIDFPLAVLLDLLIVSRLRALWFAACGVVFAALSITLNLHFGGPYFLTQLLAPRVYEVERCFESLGEGLAGPLLPLLLVAGATAWRLRRDPKRRIATLLLLTSLLVGTAFAGGKGVWINSFFTAMIAISILIGIFLDEWSRGRLGWTAQPFASAVPLLLFLWLIVPALINGIANPIHMLHETAGRQRRFDAEVAFLRRQPPPQVCENLLLCYYAQQPYLYDPFNATRLIDLHKLDPAPMLDALETGSYGAIELEHHDPGDQVVFERFPPEILAAIQRNYHPVLTDRDVILYLPNPRTRAATLSHGPGEAHPTHY